MKKEETLKGFLRQLISHIGSGYTNILVVQISKKKEYKRESILTKIRLNYKTLDTRSQRYYAKKKGFANFQAISYMYIVVLLHTKGLIKDEIDIGNGFICFKKKSSLELDISSYLKLVIFKDERNKITVRLAKETFRGFKIDFDIAYKKKSGFMYNKTLRRLSGFPPYRGIQLQKIIMLRYLKQKNKETGFKWNIPKKV